ncbi:hypothetical protein BY458DRAFT_588525 [Sporodiniella umbellata]|nr:hypothetical protein BY458DRAFT_588525 [Sporodiniella umbellata]
MGLAGQKEKQRISDDPNNLNWSKDESKFGFKMLQKMGWSPGKGLGIKEDGKQDHIKIKLKDNTLGVGATKKNIDNWLGNTDAFSRLLADLNSQPVSEASSCAQSEAEEEEEAKKEKKAKKSKKEKKKKEEKKEGKKKKEEEKETKKRKRAAEEEGKKAKKTKKEKKEKKKSKKESKEVKPSAVVLRNAARAKFLRAKKLATSGEDKNHLNEILGIKTTTQSLDDGYEAIETSTTFMAAFTV